MQTVGIICEYNPLHLGHEKQLHQIRSTFAEDVAIVCLMSGNFVQRGHPAILDQSLRAQAAIACGADLVLELPVTYALSSAEGFAAGGVSILGKFCDYLCFGSESGDADTLTATATALLQPEFVPQLHSYLEQGLSFPAARQAALGALGDHLRFPNDILAVEYCKAILTQGCRMKPMVIRRPGSYHSAEPDIQNPSATAVRALMPDGPWQRYIPAAAQTLFKNAPVHTLATGQQAILYRLRTMTDDEFADLPYGSEGLWRKFMHASRTQATLEDILSATKSKRYTRSRLDRMVMCATLGISREILETPAPYTRILALNDIGRQVLKLARQNGSFPNIGEKIDHPYQDLERRADDIYALFTTQSEPPGRTGNRRVFYTP